MKLPFALTMAWRESRRSRRRLALYLASVSLGVAALVAINSFSANVTASVHAQARSLLGADLELRGRNGFPPPVETLLDSLVKAGVPLSRVTSFPSMVLSPRTGLTRLFEVRAVTGDFPFYGEIETNPAGLWKTFRSGRSILVDPAVLIQLDARIGDTMTVGDAAFTVAGVITSSPGDVGLRTAIGPRVFLPGQFLDETNLLKFGSRAQFHAYLVMPAGPDLQRFLNRHNTLFRDRDFPVPPEERLNLVESTRAVDPLTFVVHWKGTVITGDLGSSVRTLIMELMLPLFHRGVVRSVTS